MFIFWQLTKTSISLYSRMITVVIIMFAGGGGGGGEGRRAF